MGKNGNNVKCRAIVVGQAAEEFVGETSELLESCGICTGCCDNVYAGVAWLATAGDGDVLVIGKLSALSLEDGHFFGIVAANGFSCCCVVDGDSTDEQLCVARSAGAWIVNCCGEIRPIATDWLKRCRALGRSKKAGAQTAASEKEKFRITRTELDALLGV